jgi:hypothetical protein
MLPSSAPNAPVQVSGATAALGGFSLSTPAMSPLVFKQDATLFRGQPLLLQWIASTTASRIELDLDINHHGGTRGKIECGVADTGSLEISAVLITGLLDLGVAGFPTIVMTRMSAASKAVGDGTLSLRVLSTVENAVVI